MSVAWRIRARERRQTRFRKNSQENLPTSVYSGIDYAEDLSSRGTPPDERNHEFNLATSPPGVRQPARITSGDFSNASPAPSPPTIYSRPIRRTSGYQSLGGYLSSSPSGERPVAMQSHRSPTQKPALPHLPQAHFYSAPDVDLGIPQTRGKGQPAPATTCCVFDDLGSAGTEGLHGVETVLLVGFPGGLDVFVIDKGRLDLVGRLENLRGTVVAAQLLPSSIRDDPIRSLRPLVAIVIHGPQREERPGSRHKLGDGDEDPSFDPSASMTQALEHADQGDPQSGMPFETRIEVYSLGKSEHIATLLKSPTTTSSTPHHGPLLLAAPSDGDWHLRACGRFLTVASSKSGEVFIFECRYGSDSGLSLGFACIGKTWTSVSYKKLRSLSTSSTESERPELENGSGHTGHRGDGAIFSLSNRWLAVVPPSISMKTTMHASVDLQNSHPKPPGLGSHTSPPNPQPTCDLDTPEKESLLNKVARDVTQEFMKGARWVGDQGLQAWKSYWQKPPEEAGPFAFSLPPTNGSLPPPTQNPLPPTHANEDGPPRNTMQRAVVSILDLEKLSANQSAKEDIALQPTAAFTLPDGCSLVSFTPNGLGLFTASAKGDVQHVWSLMRMAHGGGVYPRTDPSHAEKGPSVRQIARFTRMTVAKIVDVVWTQPGGERLALVTERGTVHIFDMPSSALQWPPPRRIARPVSATTTSSKSSPELEAAVPHNPSTSRFSSAMDVVTGRTQPLLAAVRGRPASIGNPFSGFSGMSLTAGAGIKGGKVVAAGFNRSVGAATGTVNTLRHLGENRLSLPGPAHAVTPGRVRWLAGRNRGAIALAGGDTVRIHRIGHSTNQKPGKRRPSAIGSKPIEMSLAKALGSIGSQGQTSTISQQTGRSSLAPQGFWTIPLPRPTQRLEDGSLHSQAEIDTNAPYQPFHTDRRVNIYVYADESTSSDGHGSEQSAAWVFGEVIPAIRTSAGAAVSHESDDPDPQQQGPIENHVSVQGNEKGQQIVITTRRRKAPKTDMAKGGEEEIFEDDAVVVDFADERV
ncbi:MAG: hypothetical protein Q9208_008046 [Pyrenodesmia sp. 3 TL-2023]